MATPTTTPEAIRNQWLTLVRAIVPTAHSSLAFRPAKSAVELTEWAEANPHACFRVFDVMDTTERVDPANQVSDQYVELATMESELIVAYPHKMAMYGAENARDMSDLMRADADQIRKAIGINAGASYVSGQLATTAEYGFERGDAVSFTVFTIEVRYYFDIASV